jgi:hypothetical protein
MDVALAVLNALVAVALAGFGVYVSIKPQPASRHGVVLAFFVGIGVLGIALAGVQSRRAGGVERKLDLMMARSDLKGCARVEWIRDATGEITGVACGVPGVASGTGGASGTLP